MDKTNISQLPPLLSSWREGQGLSQRELARKAQLNATYVALLEKGDRTPSRKTIITLARALNLTDEQTNAALRCIDERPIGPEDRAQNELSRLEHVVKEVVADWTKEDPTALSDLITQLANII
jgi:transcriptional regulator with XRE-family HTH domain